jgi:hypothetical protein
MKGGGLCFTLSRSARIAGDIGPLNGSGTPDAGRGDTAALFLTGARLTDFRPYHNGRLIPYHIKIEREAIP